MNWSSGLLILGAFGTLAWAQTASGIVSDAIFCAEQGELTVPKEAGATYEMLPSELVASKYGKLVARTFTVLQQNIFYNLGPTQLRVIDVRFLGSIGARCAKEGKDAKFNTEDSRSL